MARQTEIERQVLAGSNKQLGWPPTAGDRPGIISSGDQSSGHRSSHDSALLRAGIHAKVVQERLGHATIAITLDVYSRILPGLQEQAALAFAAVMNKARG